MRVCYLCSEHKVLKLCVLEDGSRQHEAKTTRQILLGGRLSTEYSFFQIGRVHRNSLFPWFLIITINRRCRDEASHCSDCRVIEQHGLR